MEWQLYKRATLLKSLVVANRCRLAAGHWSALSLKLQIQLLSLASLKTLQGTYREDMLYQNQVQQAFVTLNSKSSPDLVTLSPKRLWTWMMPTGSIRTATIKYPMSITTKDRSPLNRHTFSEVSQSIIKAQTPVTPAKQFPGPLTTDISGNNTAPTSKRNTYSPAASSKFQSFLQASRQAPASLLANITLIQCERYCTNRVRLKVRPCFTRLAST